MLTQATAPSTLGLPGWNCLDVLHDSDHATIFLASNPQGFKVAIKRFKCDVATINPLLINDFLAHSQALGLLQTRKLVRTLDAFTQGGQLYLVMEYVKGDTLRKVLQRKPLPDLPQRLRWFADIANALAEVHGLGLLHLDLKTSNILLRSDGTPAMLDFGMETRLLLEAGILAEDEIYCTPYYVSPERILGDIPDERSDLYALGVILYELLTGRKPYEASTLAGLLKQHALAPVPRLPAGIAAYQPLLEGLLAKFPEGRLSSADVVLCLLQEIQHNKS